MRISDWSSDVCSSDLPREVGTHPESGKVIMAGLGRYGPYLLHDGKYAKLTGTAEIFDIGMNAAVVRIAEAAEGGGRGRTKAEPLNTFGPHPTRGGEMTLMEGRSEERRVGKEGVSTCRSRWSACH